MAQTFLVHPPIQPQPKCFEQHHFNILSPPQFRPVQLQTPNPMLHYAIVFLVIALIAAFLGFGALAGTAALIAKVCFVVFLVFALVGFLKRA